MADTREINDDPLEKLKEKMRHLRSGIYPEDIDDISRMLCLSSFVKGRAEIEALLIEAAKDCFKHKSRERDIVLVSLSLLQEFDNCRDGRYGSEQYEAFLRDRFNKYIEVSDYIPNAYSGKTRYDSYDSAKADGGIPKVYASLEKKSARELNNFAEYLYDKENITDFLEKTVKEYECSGEECLSHDKLPLFYKDENRETDVDQTGLSSLQNASSSNNDNRVKKDEHTSEPIQNSAFIHEQKIVKNKRCMKNATMLALIAVIVIATSLVVKIAAILCHTPTGKETSNETGRPAIKSFSIMEPNPLFLAPGEQHTVIRHILIDENSILFSAIL